MSIPTHSAQTRTGFSAYAIPFDHRVRGSWPAMTPSRVVRRRRTSECHRQTHRVAAAAMVVPARVKTKSGQNAVACGDPPGGGTRGKAAGFCSPDAGVAEVWGCRGLGLQRCGVLAQHGEHHGVRRGVRQYLQNRRWQQIVPWRQSRADHRPVWSERRR